MTVTNFYKQTVYDPSDVKVGEINDVLVDKDGKLVAFVIGIGGFLGIDQKDVAVPFNSIRATWRPDLARPNSDVALPFNSSRATRRDGQWWLTLNATRDSLKNAPGYKYDEVRATWVPV
jgi:PRC-barrel domain